MAHRTTLKPNWRRKLLLGIAGIAATAGGFLNALPSRAQTPAVATPQAFDVVSVKLNRSAADSSSTTFAHGGVFIASNATVRGVIQEAYGLKDDRLFGGPDGTPHIGYDWAHWSIRYRPPMDA